MKSYKQIANGWEDYAKDYIGSNLENITKGVLGREWGNSTIWNRVFSHIARYLPCDVLEIGCGGGKFSQMIAAKLVPGNTLCLTDSSPTMLEITKTNLVVPDGVNCLLNLAEGSSLEGLGIFDVIFSYDVFLHLEIQHVYTYLLEGFKILRPGGIFILHQINLLTDGGWNHFLMQFNADTWKEPFDHPKRRGHIYFSTPVMSAHLGHRAGYKIEGVYEEERDIIMHFRKPE